MPSERRRVPEQVMRQIVAEVAADLRAIRVIRAHGSPGAVYSGRRTWRRRLWRRLTGR